MAREIKYAIAGNTLTIGSEGQQAIVIRDSDVHESIRLAVFMHGLKQKIGDEAALGKESTIADKFAGMQDMVSRLVAGTWREARKGGGAGRIGQVVLSLVELFSANPKLARGLAKKNGVEFTGEVSDKKVVQVWYSALSEESREAIAESKEVKVATAQRKLHDAESGKGLMD